MNVELGSRTREQAKLSNIKYFTSGMSQRKITKMSKGQGQLDGWGEVGRYLDNVSPVYHLTYSCNWLIVSV